MDMRKICKVLNAVNSIDTKLFVWNRQGVHIGQVKMIKFRNLNCN